MALKQHPMDKDKKSGKENIYVNKIKTIIYIFTYTHKAVPDEFCQIIF